MKRSRVQVSSKLVNNGPFSDVIPDRKHQRQCQCQHLCGYLQNTDAFNDEEIRTKWSTQWDWLNLKTFKHHFVFILLNHKITIYLLTSLRFLLFSGDLESFLVFFTLLQDRFLVLLRLKTLLDQFKAVVDGRPVQQRDILLVRLPDVISCLHQLLTSLQDPEPDRITQKIKDTSHDSWLIKM